jgi:hypothetical protein
VFVGAIKGCTPTSPSSTSLGGKKGEKGRKKGAKRAVAFSSKTKQKKNTFVSKSGEEKKLSLFALN